MLGLSLGLSLGNPIAAASGPYVFANSEAEALVAAMTVEPDDARKALIDTLIGGLKADGVWAAMVADPDSRLCVFAAHDAQAARLDWLNPARSASVANAPTYTTDRGYAADGAASSINLGVAALAFGQNSLCFGVWSLTAERTDGSIGGAYDGNSGVSLQPRSSTTVDGAAGRANATAPSAVSTSDGAVADGRGLFTVNRSDTTHQQLYRNGTFLTENAVAASSAPLGINLTLGLFNGTYRAFAFAAALVCPSLTAAQQLALYTRLNTYMTAIGAA